MVLRDLWLYLSHRVAITVCGEGGHLDGCSPSPVSTTPPQLQRASHRRAFATCLRMFHWWNFLCLLNAGSICRFSMLPPQFGASISERGRGICWHSRRFLSS